MKSKPVDTIDLTETDDEFCPIAADDDDDDDNDTVSCHSIMSASSKSSDALRSMLINSWLHNVISWHLVTELFVLKHFLLSEAVYRHKKVPYNCCEKVPVLNLLCRNCRHIQVKDVSCR